jgi:S1-C subfamily serine protease
MTTILQELSADMAGVVQQTRASLVRITNGNTGLGAGTVWSSEGLILTNAHVVQRAAPTVVLPDGRALPARVLAHDPQRDLALLSVKASGLASLPLRDGPPIQPGELVFAVGHPWGVARAATAGVVIGLGGDLPDAERDATRREWLMVSLVLRPGNSGGPLVDVAGRLLGVNTIMTGPEVGGAVPVHVVQAFLREATLN